MLKEKQLSEYCVADARYLHTRHPVTIKSDAPVVSILEAGISEKHCRNVYVVDSENTLLGLIKTRDILKNIFPLTSLTAGADIKLSEIPAFNATAAKDMMVPASSVPESASLAKAAAIFIKENIFELPVVDEKNKIIGQIDASEIIAFSMASEKK